MLRIVKFPSTTEAFPFGKEPKALRHVIDGIGRPVALHCSLTFSPTSATMDEGFWVVKAATVNLRTSVISQEKKMGAKTTYHLLLTLPTSLGRLALEL